MDTFACSISECGLVAKPDRTFFGGGYLDTFNEQTLTIVDLAEHICRGDSFTSVFDGRPSRETYRLGQVIAVDMDAGPGASFDALVNHPFTQAYGCLVYPTLSHTAEHPRHRAVFVLDEPILTAEGYEYAARTVYSFFPGCDLACANAARNFLGNGRIRTEKLDVWYAEQALGISDLRIFAKQLMAQDKAQRQRMMRAGESGVRHGDVPPIEETMDGLARLDPYSISYEEWVRLGAAMAHCYGETVFGRFKAWSDRPGHDPLTWNKWKSFVSDHPAPAGYGTVRHFISRAA